MSQISFGQLTSAGRTNGINPTELAQNVDNEKIQNAAGAVLKLPKHAPLSPCQGQNLCINCA